MASFTFRGESVPLVTGVEDLDLDAAEVLEAELGLDLRDLGSLPKIRMMKTLALISARAKFPDATMAEVGRLKVQELIHAFAEAAPADEVRAPVEFTGTVVLAPAVTDEPAAGEVLSPSSAGSEDSPLSA